MSKPISVRLVLYFILFQLVWKLSLGRPDKCIFQRAPAVSPGPAVAPNPAATEPPLLRPDEVCALQSIVTSLEYKPKLNIANTFCNESVPGYGFAIVCNCNSSNWCSIIKITMSDVGLSGFIDEAVGYLPNLESLILSNNKLHGVIPDTMGNLLFLNTLDLSNNQLSGAIPQNLGSCTYLKWLFLHHNLLDGPIPRTLGSLKNLTQLYLHFNRLSKSIPDELGNLTDLSILDLSENQLSGPLPVTLGNLKNIHTLYFPSNYLTGEFPTTYGNFPWLRLFSIAGNYISGPLPVEVMGSWTRITSISLVGNKFTGMLTQKLFDLPSLKYLLVSDLSNDGFTLPSNIANKDKFVNLVLRNCSIIGAIPKYISDMPSLRYLDLSFNKLTGGLPEYLKSDLIDMSFARNQLNGKIPYWVFLAFRTKMDLSFNNFSAIQFAAPRNLELNLFACCRNSATASDMLHMMDPLEMANAYCPGKKRQYHSLFINCGGGQTTTSGMLYEQDSQTSPFYISPKKNWAYSSSGDFGAETANSSDYIKEVKCGISVPGHITLFQHARLSPQSLTYYAFCLLEGNYSVTLHFAEIVYTGEEDYTSLRKRAFDVYIQGDRKIANFDISGVAQSPNKPITKSFSVQVTDNGLLEIHLYWPGKGSYDYMPSYNGPLISAISTMPEFPTGGKKPNPARLASISAAVAFPLLLLLGLSWKMGWLEKRVPPSVLNTGPGPDPGPDQTNVKVTLKNVIRATGGFNDKKKIGTGEFGTVYKAEVQNQATKHTVALKKLFPRLFKEKTKELSNAISNMKTLAHENLVKLWDFHIDKGRQILLYEYMDHKSLDKVLFDENSKGQLTWPIRVNICLGIAKGLEYLHRHPTRKFIHMNIKAANIFLDENLEAKISDFGFAHIYSEENRLMLIKKEHSRGGYMAPEYFRGEKITVKADVYSFGVLMLEIISGRRNVLDSSNQESELLVNKAHEYAQKQRQQDLADPDLESYKLMEVRNMVNLAVKCTGLVPVVRPTMSQVVSELRPKGSPQQDSKKMPSKDSEDGGPNPSPFSAEASTSRSPSMIRCQDESQNLIETSALFISEEDLDSSQVVSELRPKGSHQQVSEKMPSKASEDGGPNPSPFSAEASTSRSPSIIRCQDESQNLIETSALFISEEDLDSSQVVSELRPKGSHQQVSEKMPSKASEDGGPNPSPFSAEASTSRSPSTIRCQDESQNLIETSALFISEEDLDSSQVVSELRPKGSHQQVSEKMPPMASEDGGPNPSPVSTEASTTRSPSMIRCQCKSQTLIETSSLFISKEDLDSSQVVSELRPKGSYQQDSKKMPSKASDDGGPNPSPVSTEASTSRSPSMIRCQCKSQNLIETSSLFISKEDLDSSQVVSELRPKGSHQQDSKKMPSKASDDGGPNPSPVSTEASTSMIEYQDASQNTSQISPPVTESVFGSISDWIP